MPFTAIVTGGSGMTGGAMVEHLIQNPKTWSTVHSVSRSRKRNDLPQVKHHLIDLINTTPDQIAQILIKENVVVDYVFFAAYKAEPDEEKSCYTNGKMLDSFLQALSISQPEHRILRVVLTTGAKHYGVHLGPVRLPCMESDPRVNLSLNFYHTQEEILEKNCKLFGWHWNVCRPSHVLGTAKGNFMNLALTIALYASVQKELGDSLWFPGNEVFYRGWDDQSYAPLIAEFEEWVALHPDTVNEAFNIVNDDRNTWSRLWPFFSDYFGVPIPKDNFSAPPPLPVRTDMPTSAPLSLVAQKIGLPDIRNGVVESRHSLVKWSELPKVRQAWESLVQKHGLDREGFTYGTWGFADFVVSRDWEVVVSMSKAKKFGWRGYKESIDAYTEIFKKLEQEGIIPEFHETLGRS